MIYLDIDEIKEKATFVCSSIGFNKDEVKSIINSWEFASYLRSIAMVLIGFLGCVKWSKMEKYNLILQLVPSI